MHAQLRLRQRLGATEIFQPDKTVVALHVAEAGAVELAREPEPAVDADHHLKRKPGLQPQVHQPELGVLKIEIVVQALARFQLEVELMRGVIAADEIGQARFHAIEDPDQTLGDAVTRGELTRQGVLPLGRRVQIAHRPPTAPGKSVRGIPHAVAQRRSVPTEVFEQHPRFAQVAKHEARLVEISQATPQPQAVETTDYSRDIPAVFRQKTFNATAMMSSRFCFHTSTLSPRSRRLHFPLRRQPR